MKTPPKPVIFLIAALLLLGVALWWRFAIWPYETTENSYIKAHMTQISPRESGYVTEVLFEDNQRVSVGDLLVVIDEADYLARVAEGEAHIRVELAGIESLQRDRLVQKARLTASSADISSADADLDRSAKDLKRFGNLVGEGAVSPQARDGAEAGYRQAKALKDRALATRDEAALQLDAIDARIEQSRARINALTADLDLAKIALSHTRIVAPIAGVMGNRSVQVGQMVKPGNVLAYLIPDKEVFVEANFKETQIESMRVGQTVDIFVDALPSQHFQGTVESFAPASGSEFSLLPPENATGNFTKIVRRIPVKILFEPGIPMEALRPGLSTTTKVRVH
jgi:membrane fusion protein (multidrug efflux system)